MTATGTSQLGTQVVAQLKERMHHLNPVKRIGYVNQIVMTTVSANLPDVTQGELCEIESSGNRKVLAEVIAFDANVATLSCLESVVGIALGARVIPLGRPHCIKTQDRLFSAVLDGMGRNLDNPDDRHNGVLSTHPDAVPVIRPAPSAMRRPPISKQLITRIKVIDGLMSLGVGQRVGIFAPPGCGKSTLMAQIVRGANPDAVVFALVGERGRELRDFIEREIDDNIREKSYFVCATSDKSPVERVRCAFTATSIAEHLRDQGKSVLLVVDSLTRLARAQRELGLMAGEPTTQSGFTPSVYALLPSLVERAGQTEIGSITAVYTVLMEGERIEDDPIASEAKSLLDGHILLSQKLVERSHFPAVDPLRSLSRVMSHIVQDRSLAVAALAKRAYALYQEVELLIRLNEYQSGADPLVDEAVRIKGQLDQWCQQDRFNYVPQSASVAELESLLSEFESIVMSLRT